MGFRCFWGVGFGWFWGACSWVLKQDLQDFEDYCMGEWHSPSHDTGTFPYFRNNFTSLSGHPTPLGFNVNSPAVTLP
jgi:hypothetical protein